MKIYNKYHPNKMLYLLIPLITGSIFVYLLEDSYGYFNIKFTDKFPVHKNIYYTLRGFISIGYGVMFLMIPKFFSNLGAFSNRLQLSKLMVIFRFFSNMKIMTGFAIFMFINSVLQFLQFF
jgi:hypothetical protein